MKSLKILFFTLLVLISCSCSFLNRPEWPPVVRAPETIESGKYWTPTEEDRSRAEQLARRYASRRMSLKVPQKKIEEMKTDHTGWLKDGKLVIFIQFYDPKVYQPNKDGFFEIMLGGFPNYFTVTVDVEDWRVVDEYASPE